MADIRAVAAEIELGLGRSPDTDDPYAEIPAADRPDADLRPTRSAEAADEDAGLALADRDLIDPPRIIEDDPDD